MFDLRGGLRFASRNSNRSSTVPGSKGSGAYGASPMDQFLHAIVKLVSDFVDPEPLHFPAQLNQPLVAQLIPKAQLASPTAVVALAIHFNIKAAVTNDESKVQVVVLDTELG